MYFYLMAAARVYDKTRTRARVSFPILYFKGCVLCNMKIYTIYTYKDMFRAYTRTTSEQCSPPNIERDGWMAMGDVVLVVVMEDLEVEEEEGYEYRNTRARIQSAVK